MQSTRCLQVVHAGTQAACRFKAPAELWAWELALELRLTWHKQLRQIVVHSVPVLYSVEETQRIVLEVCK